MDYMHKDSAAGKWKTLSLAEQMANIGSEVYRAIKFKKKNNLEYSVNSLYRALELIDLTIEAQYKKHKIKEFTRLREVLCDYLLEIMNIIRMKEL